MTSPRKRFANRLNALRSTGPKTAAGKSRSAHNALRHGLAAGMPLDGGYPSQIEALARAIGGEDASSPRCQLACAIAAAQVDLMRIRCARDDLLCEAAGERKPNREFGEIIARIEPLDAYEQSALARRRVAIREFEAIRMQERRSKKIPPDFAKRSQRAKSK